MGFSRKITTLLLSLSLSTLAGCLEGPEIDSYGKDGTRAESDFFPTSGQIEMLYWPAVAATDLSYGRNLGKNYYFGWEKPISDLNQLRMALQQISTPQNIQLLGDIVVDEPILVTASLVAISGPGTLRFVGSGRLDLYATQTTSGRELCRARETVTQFDLRMGQSLRIEANTQDLNLLVRTGAHISLAGRDLGRVRIDFGGMTSLLSIKGQGGVNPSYNLSELRGETSAFLVFQGGGPLSLPAYSRFQSALVYENNGGTSRTPFYSYTRVCSVPSDITSTHGRIDCVRAGWKDLMNKWAFCGGGR